MSDSQAKSLRHWAGAGFSFLLRREGSQFFLPVLERRKRRLRRGQGRRLQGWWVMYQFSREALNLISLF